MAMAMTTVNELVVVFAAMVPLLAGSAMAGTIADIEHVVLFMQENRAFDHYFGTMAGVRGFSDPNVQVNSGTPVWQQEVDYDTTGASYLLPWYLNLAAGDLYNATQCMVAGDNGWQGNHASLNGGLNNHWASDNTPWSWGHFQRSDIPVHYAIADGWTIGDMYQESVIAATNPNRVMWTSGSINMPGSPQDESQGGYPYIDNNETPGCETGGFNCYPLHWKTTTELYQDAGVSWSVFQDEDNFDDNPLVHFAQFQEAPSGSELNKRGVVGSSLDEFYAMAADGTLPSISYVIAPTELSEHPPYSPRDGAWLQKKIVDAVTQGKGYNKTALIVSYDETGGWGDHVTPYHSLNGTEGEWLNDPYNEVGYTYSGPGFRVPFYIISPWTRNGNVFTEHSDHNSQILFIEEWLAAKGKNVTTDQMVPWRREHMSSLTNAFDFANPDYSLPSIPDAPEPHKDASGAYDGASHCESLYPVTRPEVPYTNQISPGTVSAYSELGYKFMRGALTEGRYIVFEMGEYALANTDGSLAASDVLRIAPNDINQRWVVHNLVGGGDSFTISSAADGKYISSQTALAANLSEAASFTVSFKAGSGYAIQSEDGTYISVDEGGTVQTADKVSYFKALSVTYHN